MNGFTLEELLAVEVSKLVRDDEMNFTGIGTGGKAYIRACGIPLVGIRLAQERHAPNALCMMGPVLDPLLDQQSIPPTNQEYDLIKWPCRSQIPLEDALGLFRLGKVGLAFASGAQVDKWGNLNIAMIGKDIKHPKVRLPGCLAQSELGCYAKRVCIIVPHTKRVLVDHVDFITAAGHENRDGLPGGGPVRVMTNLAIMDFNPETHQMRVKSIHPGITVEQVRENTGFDIEIPENVPVTPIPSEEDLRLIREEIDPGQKFLNAYLTGEPASIEE